GARTLTVTSGGVTVYSGTTSDSGDVRNALLNLVGIAPGRAPDLAEGIWTAIASDGINNATDTFVVVPLVDFSGSNKALTNIMGAAGSTSILVTGSNFGVHGLTANTIYWINWGIPDARIQPLEKFMTTAAGGIPAPGVQVTIPVGPP